MQVRLLIVALFLCSPTETSWWTVGNRVVTDPELVCKKVKGLSRRMEAICRGEPALLKSIKHGVEMGTQECQYQFKDRRWNCTADKKSLRKVLLKDTRETGFVNAITAAGVTYSVTRACSMGHLVECSCDKNGKGSAKNPRRENKGIPPRDTGYWEWGGCGDNVAYGYRKSKAFMDYPYRKRSDMKTLVRLHNNDAGRLAVRNFMLTECKCHGLSGSCTLRTCWRKMPQFRDVGIRLKEKFDGAGRVIPSNDGRHFIPDSPSLKAPGRGDLVYADESIDFCKYNRKSGSLGTQGRECNVTSPGVGGCDLLCCGRGYNSQIIRETINCHCRFKWCCEVTCKTCRQKRTVFTCR